MGFPLHTCKPKTPNFRPPAVAFSSVASPFFGCALSLPPSATRTLFFLRAADQTRLSAHSAARCRALLADDLRTGLPQALAARSRYGLRALCAAYGPHPVRVPCLVQGGAFRDRVTQVARQQRHKANRMLDDGRHELA